jgi:hypothetical protein
MLKRRFHIDKSGQVLIMAVALIMVVLIAITVGLFVSQMGVLHQSSSSQRFSGRSVAEEGITYGMHQLGASTSTWASALAGDFSSTDCNSSSILKTPSGSGFKLYCSTGTSGNSKLQTYQVAVKAVALAKNGQPIRAIRAYVSPRTLGLDTATGIHTAAALQLARVPASGGNLSVHWGPISCLDSSDATVWTLPSTIDSGLYPRKYSVSGLTGGSPNIRSGSTWGSAPTSDQKEYWSYLSVQFPPLIDEQTYQGIATSNTVPAPVDSTLLAPLSPTACGPANCGYFDLGGTGSGTSALFGNGGTYSLLGGKVVFINGDAIFTNVNVDSGTFIITGDLTISGALGGSSPNLHVPVTARDEYPYSSTNWPCVGYEGHMSGTQPAYDCAPGNPNNVFPTGSNMNFRGFLYVKGNLYVNTNKWNMAGALIVGDMQKDPGTGGQLTIASGNTLTVAYDDVIEHEILAKPISGSAIRLVPDFKEEVPAN